MKERSDIVLTVEEPGGYMMILYQTNSADMDHACMRDVHCTKIAPLVGVLKHSTTMELPAACYANRGMHHAWIIDP
jgi:hypothetical protein